MEISGGKCTAETGCCRFDSFSIKAEVFDDEGGKLLVRRQAGISLIRSASSLIKLLLCMFFFGASTAHLWDNILLELCSLSVVSTNHLTPPSQDSEYCPGG